MAGGGGGGQQRCLHRRLSLFQTDGRDVASKEEPTEAPARGSLQSEQPVRSAGAFATPRSLLTGLLTYFLLLRLPSPPRPPSPLRLPLMFSRFVLAFKVLIGGLQGDGVS